MTELLFPVAEGELFLMKLKHLRTHLETGEET